MKHFKKPPLLMKVFISFIKGIYVIMSLNHVKTMASLRLLSVKRPNNVFSR